MTGYQLQKTARIWQGHSDPIAYRGVFSSPPGAYPLPSSPGKGATPLHAVSSLPGAISSVALSAQQEK